MSIGAIRHTIKGACLNLRCAPMRDINYNFLFPIQTINLGEKMRKDGDVPSH